LCRCHYSCIPSKREFVVLTAVLDCFCVKGLKTVRYKSRGAVGKTGYEWKNLFFGEEGYEKGKLFVGIAFVSVESSEFIRGEVGNLIKAAVIFTCIL